MQEFRDGMRDSTPIALGYCTICMAFGLLVARGGLGILPAGILSATNLSSSGQFAGLEVILAGGSIVQLALTVAIVNLRYVLMSLSLSQRLERTMPWWQRLVVAYGVTDEIFALAMTRPVVRFPYYLGLMVLPILGWTAGGIIGAGVGAVLPTSLQSAMGVLLYAMFIAIVVPPARRSAQVLLVVGVAAAASAVLAWAPLVRTIDVGWRIIVATVIAAAVGATVAPVAEQQA